MLDTVTLQVAFGLTAFCVLVLFYTATYRTTRSPFSAWWMVSLGAYMLSAVLFMATDTGLRGIANPLGNAVAVAGSACVWAAASSLRRWRPRAVWLIGPAVAVLAWSLLDDPVHDPWAGGFGYLVGVWCYVALGTREVWRVWRERDGAERDDPAYGAALLSMTASSGLVAVFYLLRWLTYVALGPQHPLFRHVFGADVTTLLLMVLLVVVTFNMSSLSQVQRTRELQEAALQDPLTGLLNRAGFQRRAEEHFRAARRDEARGHLLMADFDDLKLLNDRFGHAAGDAALVAFGRACGDELQPIPGAFAGRLGGDEFVMLVPARVGASPEATTAGIGRRLAAARMPDGVPRPQVSFGIAAVDCAAGLEVTLARADAALYRAKAAGSGVVVNAEERPPR